MKHISLASGQRLAKRQPGFFSVMRGTLPSIVSSLPSGVRYWPVERAGTPVRGTFAGMLRQRFGAEQRGAAAYQAAAEETADSCLRELYTELAGDEDAHAWLIRGILEQM